MMMRQVLIQVKYYVINSNQQVYLVLRSSVNDSGAQAASTVEPTGTNGVPFLTSDGYMWKFMYSVSGHMEQTNSNL